jgi:glucose/arabinose dehydrogenase
MFRRTALALLCGTILTACDREPPAPPSVPGPDERVTGDERLGWEQPALDAGDLETYRYAVYVNGARVELSDAACDAGAGPTGFACTARLPPLTAGTHVLELASFIVDEGIVLESVRSTPLRLTVGTALSSLSSPSPLDEATFSTVDGVMLRLQPVAGGLRDPSDIAFAPDGRIFVAESRGTFRVVREGQVLPELSVSAIGAGDDQRLLAIALDPAFAETRHVFAVYTAPGRDGSPTFTVARFREQQDALVDRIVIADDVPAADDPHAALRFGPDGKLYVALDDGGVARWSGDLASRNGKLLRMNTDGSTPADQDNLTPVFSHGFRSPRSIAWQRATGEGWLADENGAGEPLLYAIVSRSPRVRGAVRAAHRLPTGTVPSSMMFYRGREIPAFEDDLFVASEAGEQLLRLSFDRSAPRTIVSTERLLHTRVGPLRVVAQRADGAMYVATSQDLARIVASETR